MKRRTLSQRPKNADGWPQGMTDLCGPTKTWGGEQRDDAWQMVLARCDGKVFGNLCHFLEGGISEQLSSLSAHK